MLNVQTKRGCSFHCVYCTYPRVEGRRVRLRGPEAVADEMEGLMDETGVRHFFVVDSVLDREWDSLEVMYGTSSVNDMPLSSAIFGGLSAEETGTLESTVVYAYISTVRLTFIMGPRYLFSTLKDSGPLSPGLSSGVWML